jgi:hypothetical protein
MLRCMRTTLTLDDDVAALLSQVQEHRETSLKEVVNAALRIGLACMSKPAEPRSTFRTGTWDTGKCALPNLDNIAEVLAFAEGENHR